MGNCCSEAGPPPGATVGQPVPAPRYYSARAAPAGQPHRPSLSESGRDQVPVAPASSPLDAGFISPEQFAEQIHADPHDSGLVEASSAVTGAVQPPPGLEAFRDPGLLLCREVRKVSSVGMTQSRVLACKEVRAGSRYVFLCTETGDIQRFVLLLQLRLLRWQRQSDHVLVLMRFDPSTSEPDWLLQVNPMHGQIPPELVAPVISRLRESAEQAVVRRDTRVDRRWEGAREVPADEDLLSLARLQKPAGWLPPAERLRLSRGRV
eukprot:TRINITY_DN55631_c0_g1_i1.p1 TRINITY_DN55631_c0_g1~~TRINITY_DN55631_c0_g1_i1.p1  ORF type:complete len:289 (+),score=74.41 TRINITY_DN55631_c0_g1_i1:76-867(+)